MILYLNFQLKPFISWGPDPEAIEVDAFTVDWSRWINVNTFPPFSQIQKAICKLEENLADGLFILPNWPTAVWYSQIMRLLTRRPILIPRGNRMLQLVHTDSAHPFHRRLQLLAVTLSGKPSKYKDFMDELRRSSKPLADNQLNVNIHHTLRDGKCFVLGRTVIPFDQL